MKKIRCYKGVMMLATASIMTLFSSCSKEEFTEHKHAYIEDNYVTMKNSHTHLIIDTGEKPIIFRECEGYSISYDNRNYGGSIQYYINGNSGTVLKGTTSNYNVYKIDDNHSFTNMREIEEELINEKGAKVFKLKK